MVQTEKSETIEKNYKESNSTQSVVGQNALIQSKLFEPAIQ